MMVESCKFSSYLPVDDALGPALTLGSVKDVPCHLDAVHV